MVAPRGARASPALTTTWMKSGRWNDTARASYGGPASAASACSMSPFTGSSRRCHSSDARLIRAKLSWNPAFRLHGSKYTSSGATRR